MVDRNEAIQRTKARGGKPRDVEAMRQKMALEDTNIPVPSARPGPMPAVREQSGTGMGDFLDMIMQAAYGSNNVMPSAGSNAPSSGAQEMLAAQQSQDTLQDQMMPEVDAMGNPVGPQDGDVDTAASARAGANNANSAIDGKTAATIDDLDSQGMSLGEIAAALGGVVGAGAVATYLATRKKPLATVRNANTSNPVDEMIDATMPSSAEGVNPASANPIDPIDQSIQDKVEGRDNTARPAPNRFANDRNAVDDMVEQTLGARADDISKNVEGATGVRPGANRFSGKRGATEISPDVERILSQAASMSGSEGARLLQENGIELTDDVMRKIIERSVRGATSRAVR